MGVKEVKRTKAESAVALTDEQSWQAVLRRDAAFDGTLYYGVTTTGIYCRPSCAAKRPNRGNIAFFGSPDEAERAGLRPCKRCKPRASAPGAADAALVCAACREIETAEYEPSLATLAAHANLSPHHFHRLFKSIAGVTPKAYATAHRRNRVQAGLRAAPSVTDAIFQAGYRSSARFYADTGGMLGMTPSSYRAGGAHTKLHYAVASCDLGHVLVAASDSGISAILLGDDGAALLADLVRRFPHAAIQHGDTDFGRTVAAVVRLIEEPRAGLALPFDVRGTAFQHRVWAALQAIPAGSTASYGEIARAIGKPEAVRAVATACAANPAAVAIPCHRVVRSDGALAGYRWGITRKRALLAREKKP